MDAEHDRPIGLEDAMFGQKQKLALTALAIPFALSLSGCATTSSSEGMSASKSDGPTRSEMYVYNVNRTADRRNVRVIWVNPPKDDRPSGVSYSLEATVGDEDSSR